MRVLIVEDDPTLAESIAGAVSNTGMIPSMVGNGIQADSLLVQATSFKRPYDAVILDLTLPGMDGMDVLKAMRRRKDLTPVLVLTARITLADKVGGLEGGADDYLAKPFETEEMLARLRAIARRRNDSRDTNPSLGNLEFDAGRGCFTVMGALLALTPKQHGILDLLFRSRGRSVSKEFLMNLDDDGATMEIVDTWISRLRKRLRDADAGVNIRTLHGVGYVLEAEAGSSNGNGAT
jgi:two-component system response regulator TctD